MKSFIRSFICIALVAIMLISAASCGGTPEQTTEIKTEATENTTEKPTAETTDEATTEPVEKPSEASTEKFDDDTTEQTTDKVTEEPTETETKKPDVVLDENALRFDEKGNFEIAIFSDLRLNKTVDAEIIANIVKLIDEIKPSLVLFGGDIHDGSVTNEAELRVVLDAINAPLEERGIKWCHTFGVDSEGKGGSSTGFTRAEQYAVYATYKYCITPETAEGIYGDSNYVLSIRSNDSENIAFNLWCLDTNGYLNDYENGMEDGVLLDNLLAGKTNLDTVHFSQMLWYWNKSVEFEQANGGEKVPGMMYMQVPVYQLYYLRKNATATEMTGSMKNIPSASERESGIVWTCFERGDIKGIFCGYDAQNDYAGKYLDMIMAGCSSIGTTATASTAGARVVTLSDNGGKIATSMAYLNERGEGGVALADPENPDIFKLVIDTAYATVSNGGTSGYKYGDHDSNVPKEIVNDRDLKLGAVEFDPSGSTLSSYTIPSKEFNYLFQDGFSYEVLVRVDVNPSQYVGIIDYAEAGGFALNVYPSVKSHRADIHVDLGLGDSGYVTLTHTIYLEQWNHIVFSYDGKNIHLFVNGELVASESSTATMRLPKFNGVVPEYICIGGCAQSGYESGIRGFDGAIAICNIFSEPLSEDQVKGMFESITLPEYEPIEDEVKVPMDPLNPDILKLDISNGWAQNTVTDGPEIIDLDSGGIKYIEMDTTINRNVVVFGGGSKANTYIFRADSFETALLDGFAYELYFKATGTSQASSYMSVLDFCEGGGFGFNLYTSENGKLTAKAELNANGTYLAPTCEINIDEWVHCVFSFDGTNLSLYFNGKLVDSITTSQIMRLPDFGNNMKMVCIGSGAGKNSTSKDGFTGLLAICNIFSDPVTAEDVATMYSTNAGK